jgi:hypothetical protein
VNALIQAEEIPTWVVIDKTWVSPEEGMQPLFPANPFSFENPLCTLLGSASFN